MKAMLKKIDGTLPSNVALSLRNPLERLELQTANVEILANSAAWGAAAGYYLTAMVLSANRTDEAASNAWVGTMPPLGAITGATLGLVVNRWLKPHPGTVAWATANTWWGLAWGQTLGNILLADNTEVENIPFTFAFPFLTMSLLPAATYAIGEHWQVSPGDVAIANSTAFWVSALTMPYLYLNTTNNAHVLPTLLPLSMLTHFGMIAAAPLFDIPRTATWLLEAGAGVGFVTGLAVLLTNSIVSLMFESNILNPNSLGMSPELFMTAYFTGTTALGLAAGAVLIGTNFGDKSASNNRNTLSQNPWLALLKPQLSPLVINNLNQQNASVSGVLASWRY